MTARNKQNPRLLWVEGKDDSAVVQSLCHAHGLPVGSFHVVEKEGLEPLVSGLRVQLRAQWLERLGVVVDADDDAAARWARIRGIFTDLGYGELPDAVPAGGLVMHPPNLPHLGIWIMPDNTVPGMLEDFAGKLIAAEDWLWIHAGEVVAGIPAEHRVFSDLHLAKARIHTWLAWQEEPGSPMGQAIGKGDLDAHAPLAEQFVDWLRRLMLS